MAARISVVILNFNGECFIKDLFLSLSQQSFEDFDIVFVDNASTDASVKILRRLLQTNEFKKIRVLIIANNLNLGFCAGNNIGLAHATGDYVVFLNNDTFVDPDWLEKLVEVLDTDPSVGACQSTILFSQSKKVQNAGLQLDIYGWSFPTITKEPANVTTTGFFYCMGTSFIVRRSIMKKCQGFDEKIFSGDYNLGWMIRLLDYGIAVSKRSICYHYGSFATRTLFTRPAQFYEACKERVYVLLKNYSFSRIVVRIPVSLVLMFLAAIVWCQETQSDYLTPLLKSLIWNLRNYGELLVERGKIQKNRKVNDCQIEKFMSKYPFVVSISKKVGRQE